METDKISTKQKLLVISEGLPYPPDANGRNTVVFPIIKYLKNDFEIDLLYSTISNEPQESKHVEILEGMCENIYTFSSLKIKYFRYFTAIFHMMPLVFVLYSKRKFTNEINKILKPVAHKYDSIIVADSHIARFIPDIKFRKDALKIFIPFDYLYLMFSRIAESTTNIFSKFYHWFNSWKLSIYEPLIYSYFNKIIFVSTEDKIHFSKKHNELSKKIEVIPMGINSDKFREPFTNKGNNRTILFFGNMNYEPNRLAVNWFFENVFFKLKQEVEGIKWLIVGRDADRFINISDKSIEIHSSVPSLEPFLESAALVISPLKVGTGVKNKVLEAMAYSKVVIGTTLSFDGIGITNNNNALIADEPIEFLNSVKAILNNNILKTEIESNAYNYVKNNFSLEIVIQKWKSLLN